MSAATLDILVPWLIGVGIVFAGLLILLAVAEVAEILVERDDRRCADYIRNPISESEARLRNELARHHDGIERRESP